MSGRKPPSRRPTPSSRHSSRSTSGGGANWLIIIGAALAGAIALAVLVMLFNVVNRGMTLSNSISNIFNRPTPTPVVDVKSLVIKQIQSASELTTAIYSVEAVVPVSQANKAILGFIPLADTKMLYIAHGRIRAGIDLQKLKAEDVEVFSNTIIIRLPPPEIQEKTLDPDRSSVYDIDRPIMGEVDPGLINEAQRVGLQRITQAVCEQGILNQANTQAELAIKALFSNANFDQVNVVTQSGNCK